MSIDDEPSLEEKVKSPTEELIEKSDEDLIRTICSYCDCYIEYLQIAQNTDSNGPSVIEGYFGIMPKLLEYYNNHQDYLVMYRETLLARGKECHNNGNLLNIFELCNLEFQNQEINDVEKKGAFFRIILNLMCADNDEYLVKTKDLGNLTEKQLLIIKSICPEGVSEEINKRESKEKKKIIILPETDFNPNEGEIRVSQEIELNISEQTETNESSQDGGILLNVRRLFDRWRHKDIKERQKESFFRTKLLK
jgi:hypothetical protein